MRNTKKAMAKKHEEEIMNLMVNALNQLDDAEKNEKFDINKAFNKEEFDFCLHMHGDYELTDKNVKKFAEIIDRCTKNYR